MGIDDDGFKSTMVFLLLYKSIQKTCFIFCHISIEWETTYTHSRLLSFQTTMLWFNPNGKLMTGAKVIQRRGRKWRNVQKYIKLKNILSFSDRLQQNRALCSNYNNETFLSSDISVLLKLMNSNVEIELYSSLSMCSYYSQSWLYVPLRRSKPSKQLTSAVGEAKNKTELFKTCYSGVVVHKCLNWKKVFLLQFAAFSHLSKENRDEEACYKNQRLFFIRTHVWLFLQQGALHKSLG